MAHDTQAIAASLTANVIASPAGAKVFSNFNTEELGDEVVHLFWKIHKAVVNSSVGSVTPKSFGVMPIASSPHASGGVSTASPKAS